MTKLRGLLFIMPILLILLSCSTNPPVEKQIAPFTFTNQHGKPFGSEDLAGQIWIAQFLFTSCQTVCPKMATEMVALQERLAEEGIEATFVSFTVDPEIDTPDVLKQYMANFTDKDNQWYMLTGYTQTEIEIFAREQFQTIVQKPSSSNQVLHGTNFYLIDQEGYIRNEYHYIDQNYMDDLVRDIKKIQK